MTRNRATIYSNGIADFQRTFGLTKKQPCPVSIPVHQDHLADVLASLTVMGDVMISSPPSYQPANQDETNLKIGSDDALLSLARQLSGAKVVVTTNGKQKVKGTLVGLHDQQAGSHGEPFLESYLVIKTGDSLKRVAVSELYDLKFEDEVIQNEIEKALSQSLRRIKPNSTLVELELSTTSEKSEAVVQYTVPAAAWKIAYRLILLADKSIEFHGHAIVDNNTEEDWKDFTIAVVMGQPITFSTDLADSKIPWRKHINIVQERAFGAVEVEEASMAGEEFYMEPPASAPQMAMMRKSASAERSEWQESAEIESADVKEAGDFCIFESGSPVSIAAHRSAMIPIFKTTLSQSTAVLHYKKLNHEERPFRSIRFKNTTDHALGRGVCTVFDQMTYAGSCVLPSTRVGSDSLLPHALETGVRVLVTEPGTKNRRIGIRISDGVAYESHHQLAQADYLIENGRDEAFPFVLDHQDLIYQSTKQCFVVRIENDEQQMPEEMDPQSLKTGVRIEFPLEPKAKLILRIVETKVQRSRVVLAGDTATANGLRVKWLFDNIVELDSELANEEGVRNCLELQRQLDENHRQVNHATAEIERLIARQERLRNNIKSGGEKQQTVKWQTDLGRAEDAIVQLEEEHIPDLKENQAQIRDSLFEAMKTLSLEWNE